MRKPPQIRAKHLWSALLLVASPGVLFAQPQAEARPAQLIIKSQPDLKAFLRETYHHQLAAQGGDAPYSWKLATGSLPRGISLEPSGALDGSPTQIGDFHFVLAVSDSGRPAHERNREFVLHVLAPLLVQWSNPAKINGQRIEGSVKVSNPTGKDVDLTAIVLAVNEIGRATAIGYQHFTLKHDTVDLEIPFGENLPRGAYEVNVDVVAENAESNTIRRARLVTPRKLQVVQGP
jgi:hypothetical protein